MTKIFRGRHLLYWSLLLIGPVAAYAGTWRVPWYLDDLPQIVENPVVHSLPLAVARMFQPRGIVDLSFAANFALSGTSPASYHLVNLALHLLVTGLLFLFLRRVCRFPEGASLFGALLFALHPLQTQAVNYVVQRATLLSAAFALAALLTLFRLHDRRQEEDLPAKTVWSYTVLTIFLAFWAVWSKQNAVVLPLLYLVCGVLWRGWSLRRALRFAWPLLLVSMLACAVMLVWPLVSGAQLVSLAQTHALKGLAHNSPLHYFATEQKVLFYYLCLLLWPTGLRLSYDWPIVSQTFTVYNIALFAGHCVLLAAAWRIRRRFRAFTFAIFWFYCALLVESSILPLDPVFEHRLYLPLVGFAVLAADLLRRIASSRRRSAVCLVIVLVLMGLTWQRNRLWLNPVAFAEQNAELSPASEGVWVALGGQYLRAGRLDAARKALTRALALNPDYALIYVNLSSVSLRKGEFRRAASEAQRGLTVAPENLSLMQNLAAADLQTGRSAEARRLLLAVTRRGADSFEISIMLGQAALAEKDWREAERWLQKGIAQGATGDYLPYYLLGTARYELRDLDGAATALVEALQLKPQDVGSLQGLGFIRLEQGDVNGARAQLRQLRRLNPSAAAVLQNAIARRGG